MKYELLSFINLDCVQPDEGSVSQLCCTVWEMCANLAHSIPWGEPSLRWILGTDRKACFEASSWVITDIRKNSEAAASNTFISAGCYRVDVVASLLYTVTPLLFSLSLPHCPSKCFCDMWIVSLLLCTAAVLSCVVFVCQMTIKCVQKYEHKQIFSEWVFPFFYTGFVCFKLLPE